VVLTSSYISKFYNSFIFPREINSDDGSFSRSFFYPAKLSTQGDLTNKNLSPKNFFLNIQPFACITQKKRWHFRASEPSGYSGPIYAARFSFNSRQIAHNYPD